MKATYSGRDRILLTEIGHKSELVLDEIEIVVGYTGPCCDGSETTLNAFVIPEIIRALNARSTPLRCVLHLCGPHCAPTYEDDAHVSYPALTISEDWRTSMHAGLRTAIEAEKVDPCTNNWFVLNRPEPDAEKRLAAILEFLVPKRLTADDVQRWAEGQAKKFNTRVRPWLLRVLFAKRRCGLERLDKEALIKMTLENLRNGLQSYEDTADSELLFEIQEDILNKRKFATLDELFAHYRMPDAAN